MSLEPLFIREEGDPEIPHSMCTYRPLAEYSDEVAHYISSTFNEIQQFKTDLNTKYQHEKHALTELNELLRCMIDDVERLESQNSQHVTKLVDLRQQSSSISVLNKQNDEYNRIQADIITVNYDTVGYESELELFQLQIKLYQGMIEAEKQSTGNYILKLEEESNQSASTLINLRTSYVEMEQKIASFRSTCKDTFQHNYNLISVDTPDFAEFWKLEWEQIIKKIRHDFEVLYGAIHQETISFYEKKSKEIQVALEQITQYQQVEQEKYVKIQQKLQRQCDEVQKKLAYEKEVLLKSEAIYSKLESELEIIQIQHEERFEAQSNEFNGLQESMIAMVSSVEEMQRRLEKKSA
ncbi:unnamed protein product [Rotaria sp. Silwood1]|nr:unnamed protein product [Rotaria sp. Silwood1]CAF1325427.1 unnamed protein product [Rotaria sp. Silwood1]CAF3519457.1 unnamed protein product [Rotaria sp. Silwood1]CAF3544959.1 unnamed protein product [Rotaria sp. Silwood1]CAF3550479.1 unnamed protein product [Rotaria sp. Silwood1]